MAVDRPSPGTAAALLLISASSVANEVRVRPRTVVFSVCVGVAALWVWVRPDLRGGAPPAPVPTSLPRGVRPASSAGPIGATATRPEGAWATRRPDDPREFDILPPEHGYAVAERVMGEMPAWLDQNFPDAQGAVLGADCAEPPCLLGLAYEQGGFTDPTRAGAFLQGYQAEVERRTGWEMTSVSMEEDRDGRQYVWMYAVPRDCDACAPFREEMLNSADARHEGYMATRRPPQVEAEPQGNEAG